MSEPIAADRRAIEQAVRAFIVERFLFGREDFPLAGDTLLIEEHVIDSAGVLELVAFLEDTWAFTVEDLEVIPDHLDTIDRLVAFVERKRGG